MLLFDEPLSNLDAKAPGGDAGHPAEGGSAGTLLGESDRFGWLWRYPRLAQAGASIWLFDVRSPVP